MADTEGLLPPETFIAVRFSSLVRERNERDLHNFLTAHGDTDWTEPIAELSAEDHAWLAETVFTSLERERYGL